MSEIGWRGGIGRERFITTLSHQQPGLAQDLGQPMKGPMNILILVALSLIPLVGLLMLGRGGREVWRGFASTHWPQTKGVVLTSAVSEETTTSISTRTSSTMYSSKITVGYKVNGKEYQTSTLHFGQTYGSSDPSDAEMARLRYPQGAEVSVTYDPQAPTVSALKVGFTAEALTLPAAGLALTLLGILIMIAFQSATAQGLGMSIMVPRMFGGIFMLIGLILMTPGVRNLMRARDSVAWPKATGVVLFTRMTSSTIVDRDAEDNKTRSTTYNSPVIVEYDVDGHKHYTNSRAFGQLAGSDEAWAQQIADRYPIGAKIPVTYSTADPDLAVLEPGIASEAYWLPGAGAAFFLFGLLVIVVVRF